jgi:acyl dehydratase
MEGLMTDLYFKELEIGTRSVAGPYPVSKDEIIQFAKQYDPEPRHIDEEAAARSVFGGLTACSAHTFSIFILLTTRRQPRLHVLAGLGWDDLRLPHAVRPGDELDLETTVLEMRESKSKPDKVPPFHGAHPDPTSSVCELCFGSQRLSACALAWRSS